jgi:hypothetical protein
MVTSQHEGSHRIFQERTELLSPVFRLLGVPLPNSASVEVLSADVTEIRPLERRVDSVLRIEPEGGPPFLLAIEAQGRKAADKPASWMYYLSYLRAKYDCPALLLVTCQDKATSGWATGPFDMGIDGWTALTLRPLVAGPDNVPVIIDPQEAAQDLALATFSAMTHGRSRDSTPILKALASALGSADSESAEYYTELLEIALGDTPARATWRDLMSVGTYFPGRGTYRETAYLEGKAEGQTEGKAEGKAEGEVVGQVRERAGLILRVLDQRLVPVAPEVRDRITACTDLDTLSLWLDRAFSVDSVQDLFADVEKREQG